MAAPQLYLLGPPRVRRDGQPRDLAAAKALALLAYLAVTRTSQSREALQALLWPDSAADAARKNLRNTLWTIRKTLGDDALPAGDDRLGLPADLWVDIWEFERLAEAPGPRNGAAAPDGAGPTAAVERQQAAAALYGGLLLDGLAFPDAAEFEIWLAGARERLEQVYLRVLAALADHLAAESNWAGVIAMAQRALAHDSLQEPMHRALMLAHARRGERAEALRQYDTLRATLDRELGVEPLPETEGLRTAILGGEVGPQADGGAPAILPARPTPRPVRAPVEPGQPFVGRQAELAALDAERAAALGQARVVLLTGEVGIGKSRLWREWTARLPEGSLVLETRCLDSTQTLPFAPLTELFRRRTCLQALFAVPSPVPPLWLAEVARLLPEIRLRLPDLPAPAVLPAEEERRRVFEALVQCFLALGGQPLILFVDDLHWADQTTLAWLDYLVHRVQEGPLLLVAAYRPEDAPAPLARLLAGWGREGIVRRVAVPRLSAAEASALIAALGGGPELATRAQTQSAGNPYFLIELCRAAPLDVPPVLAELIRARLDRLPAAGRQVLQAAAVLEPDFDFATLRRTSGRDEEETLDAVDALRQAALLVETNGAYTFSHPLVAAVVREGLGAARRAFLHRRAAEAREAAGPGRLPELAGRLAADWAAAGDVVHAARYAELAAERALTLAAPAEAVAFFRQALALQPTPARRIGLGRALYRLGDPVAGRAAFLAAAEAAAAAGDRPNAVRATLGVADSFMPAGRHDEVIRWVERALPDLDTTADPEAHARAHFLLGAALLASEHTLDTAEQHLREAARLAAAHQLGQLAASSRFELGNLRAQRGDLAGALQDFADSIVLARAAGEPFQEVLGHNNLAYHALLLGDLAGAREHVSEGLRLAEAGALRVPLQYLYSTRGEIALAAGAPAEAETWFARGLAEAERNGNLKQAANYQANLGLAARDRGDFDAALLRLDAARAAAAPLDAPYLQTQIDLWLTELYRARGEQAAAEEALARAEARLAGGGSGRLEAWAARLRQAPA